MGSVRSEYRGASWSFRTRVIIPPNTTHDHVERLIENIFTRNKPDSVTNIEARFKKSELSTQALPLEGYIQLSRGLLTTEYHLARWIPNTVWTPVGGRLAGNDDYIKYHESKQNPAEYAHIQISGMPALSKGGRKRKSDKVCETKSLCLVCQKKIQLSSDSHQNLNWSDALKL